MLRAFIVVGMVKRLKKKKIVLEIIGFIRFH